MSLASQTSAGLTALATAVKTLRTGVGDLSTLTTTTKTSVVAAINEVKASGGGGGDTNVNIDGGKPWSIPTGPPINGGKP